MAEDDAQSKLDSIKEQVVRLHQRGDYPRALVLARQALELAETDLGPAHPATAVSLNNMGAVLQAMGDLSGALPYYERTLSIREMVLGYGDSRTASSLNNLGTLLWAMGEFPRARVSLEQALGLYKAILGSEHLRTAQCSNNLGLLLREMGDLLGAREYLEQALSIQDKLRLEHPEAARDLNSLRLPPDSMGEGDQGSYLELELAQFECQRPTLSSGDQPGTTPEQAIPELHHQASQLSQHGEHQQALVLLQQALQLAETHLGPEHPQTAVSLNNLGNLLLAMRDLSGARSCYERVLKVLGSGHPDNAAILNNLDALLESWNEGEQGARQTVVALNQKAHELYQQGQHQQAIPLVRQALQLAETALGAEHSETATCLNNLGYFLNVAGDPLGARPALERALDIQEKTLGADHPRTAASLNSLATVLHALGDFSGARVHWERAFGILEKVRGPEHPDTALIVNNLGVVLRDQGDLAGARPYHERALALSEKVRGAEHPETATCLNNLGNLLRALNDLSGARPHLERALSVREKILGSGHPDVVQSLNNLGELLRDLRDLSGARLYHERALSASEMALGVEHPYTAHVLHNIGALLQDMGDLAGARSYCERALSLYEKVLGAEHPRTATNLNNLSIALQASGDLSGARSCCERALSIREKVLGPEHPDTGTSFHNLACLYIDLDRDDEALTLMQKAAAIDGLVIGQVFVSGSERQRAAFLKTCEGRQAAFLSLVWGRLGGSAPAVRAALDLVLRRKAITTEALAAQRDAVLGGRYPHLQGPLRRCADLRQHIARTTLAGPGPEGEEAHRQQLSRWTNEKETLEAELARQIPEMALAKKLLRSDRRSVAPALDEGVALVEFVRFRVFFRPHARGEPETPQHRYLAFVLPAGQPDNVQMIDLGEADAIDSLIADFRSSIIGEVEPRNGRNMVKRRPESAAALRAEAGLQLRAAVFDKLVPALGEHKRLLLAPDGTLPDCRSRYCPAPMASSSLMTTRSVTSAPAATCCGSVQRRPSSPPTRWWS